MKQYCGFDSSRFVPWFVPVLFLLAGVGMIVGCAGRRGPTSEASSENPVVSYFQGAEFQFETREQGRELLKALDDMIKLDVAELRKCRYADYQMREGTWTLAEVIHAYVVPSKPVVLEEDDLFGAVKLAEAQAVIRAQREVVEQALAE